MQTIVQNLLRRPYWLAALLAGNLFLFSQCGQSPSSPISQQNSDSTALSANTTTAQLSVAPPFAGIDLPFQSFPVNAQKGGKIRTATGTQIDIPADAFVDAQGNPVKGEVQIEYREMHDAAAILATGIPMHNPATGEYMETAGMFEIQGKLANGEAVKIAANKELYVQCASFNTSDQTGKNPAFDFFELERPSCGWKKQGTAPLIPNLGKSEQVKELDKQLPPKPVAPVKRNETDGFVFELEVNLSQFPELNAFKGVVWEYAGKPKDRYNPENNKEIFEHVWHSITLEKGSVENTFTMRLVEGKYIIEIPVRPVLAGGEYDKALKQYNDKFVEYQRSLKTQEQARQRLQQESDFVRAFQVSNFGIFNWDIWHRPGRVACKPQPQIAHNEGDEEQYLYFLITASNRSVVRYSYSDLQKFSFDPAEENKLIAVLPDNKIAIFDVEDFKKLNPTAIQNTEAVFTMRVLPNSMRSLEDIQAALS